jgi:uncharacterized membrane protein YsdA (DUF1294 family)
VVGGVTAAVALASAVARAGGVRVGEDGLLVVGLVVLAAGAVLAVALVRGAGHR